MDMKFWFSQVKTDKNHITGNEESVQHNNIKKNDSLKNENLRKNVQGEKVCRVVCVKGHYNI